MLGLREEVCASVGPLGGGVCYRWALGRRCVLVLGHWEQVCASVRLYSRMGL